jgi:hypothetical protein
MFPDPITAYEVKLMEQRELVAAMTEQSRHLTTAVPARGTKSAGAVRQFLSAALDRIVMVLPDNRDSLRSKEQELAAVGVTWPPDPAYDEMLARQIETAQAGRHAGYPATQSVPSPATSSVLSKTPLAPQPPAVPARA